MRGGDRGWGGEDEEGLEVLLRRVREFWRSVKDRRVNREGV